MLENPIVEKPIKDDGIFGIDATGDEAGYGDKVLENDDGEFVLVENAAKYLIEVHGWKLKEAGED